MPGKSYRSCVSGAARQPVTRDPRSVAASVPSTALSSCHAASNDSRFYGTCLGLAASEFRQASVVLASTDL
jgi:hypothetical protein